MFGLRGGAEAVQITEVVMKEHPERPIFGTEDPCLNLPIYR